MEVCCGERSGGELWCLCVRDDEVSPFFIIIIVNKEKVSSLKSKQVTTAITSTRLLFISHH